MTKKFNIYEMKLKQLFMEDFPQRFNDDEFIQARAAMALDAFMQADRSGVDVDTAEHIANEVLYAGLQFSLFKEYVYIIDEIAPKMDEEDERVLAVELMEQDKQIYEKYTFTDDFRGTQDYVELYNRLKPRIRDYMIEHGIIQQDASARW